MNSSTIKTIVTIDNKFDHAKRRKISRDKDGKKGKWFRKSHNSDKIKEQKKNFGKVKTRRQVDTERRDIAFNDFNSYVEFSQNLKDEMSEEYYYWD